MASREGAITAASTDQGLLAFPVSRHGMGGALFMTAAALGAALAMLVASSFISGLNSFPADRDKAAAAEDLVAFHRAGEMALRGEGGAAYDPAAFRAGLADHQKGLLWLNPPHAYFVMAPIATLSYGAAKALWIALCGAALAGLFAAANLKSPSFLTLAFFSPAMLISVMLLQLGGLVALGLSAALVLADRRPVIAGIILALLTMKPQYGLMVPVFLIAAGCWRAALSAALATIALIIASAIFFGPDSWFAFADSLKTVHGPFSRQVLEGTATFSQTAGKFGASEAARAAAQGVGVASCAAAIFLAVRRLPRQEAIALTLLLSLAASPSAWIYDWPIIIAGLAFLAMQAKWPLHVQLAAGLLWLAPLAPTFSDGLASSVAPAIALYATVISAMFWRFNGRHKGA